MTPKTTTATADASLAELLARVERGERIEILRDGQPVAVIAASAATDPDSRLRRFEALCKSIRASGFSMTREEILSARDEGRR